jgi:hypothetical protein
MIVIPPIPSRYRKHPAPKAAPAALTLTAATYDSAAMTLTLQFDRAVNAAGFDGTQVDVFDGTFQLIRMNATGGVTVLDARTVRLGLVNFGDYTDTPDVLLTAPATTGLVAADDGGTWAGVTAVELPIP